jgi:mRNA interferase MazF
VVRARGGQTRGRPRDQAPARGDIVWLDFDPQAGREQAGRRPALVVSPEAYNAKVGLMLACPVTSQVKGYPFEVALPEGLPVQGVILSDHLKSLDFRARRAERAAVAPPPVVAEVLAKLRPLLT